MNAIAPGEGVEADNDQVGGRDAGDAAKRRVVNRDSPDPEVRKDGTVEFGPLACLYAKICSISLDLMSRPG